MMRKPDWTVYHRVMRKLKGVAKTAVDAWTQGSLRTHTAGERVLCSLCNVPVTMKHLIWECQYHDKPLPAAWDQNIQANENTMLWSRGLVEVPDYRLTVGMDSLEVHGVFAHGWPVRVTPSQRLAIGSNPQAGIQDCGATWLRSLLEHGKMAHGSSLASARVSPQVNLREARAWFFGCWLLLQATLGRHQVNVANRAGWAAINKGGRGTCAPYLWHSLPEAEWSRLKVLHVPKKLLQQTGDDKRAWLQFQEASMCALSRVHRIAPGDLEKELQADDLWRQEIYEVAAQRISQLLTDPDHYMHGKLAPVPTPFQVRPDRPRGRLDILRKLTQQEHQAGQHQWVLQGHGIRCQQCGLHVKGCSTHAEISSKQATTCPGEMCRTLTQIKKDMIATTEALADSQGGRRWFSRPSSSGCSRCWQKVSGRCSKEALQKLSEQPCVYGPVDTKDLEVRTKINPQHSLWQRGSWLECQRCHRVTKIIHCRVQSWLAGGCTGGSKQCKLRFGPNSDS